MLQIVNVGMNYIILCVCLSLWPKHVNFKSFLKTGCRASLINRLYVTRVAGSMLIQM